MGDGKLVKKKQKQKSIGRTLEEEREISPRWKEVLLKIYREEPFSLEEHRHFLDYLKKHDLVEQRRKPDLRSPFDRHGNWTYILTRKGFDVAGKIEERRETFLYRLSSLLLTGILALTLLITVLHQMNLVNPGLLLIAYIIALGAMMVVFRRGYRTKPTKK